MKTVGRTLFAHVLLWSMIMNKCLIMIMAASHNNIQHHYLHYRAAFVARPHSGVAHRSKSSAVRRIRPEVASSENERSRNRGIRNTMISRMSSGQSDPALEFVHGPTNVTVVLLGCLHGSSSSALDVERVMMRPADSEFESGSMPHQNQNYPHPHPQYNNNTTDVLVLELCAARFADLQRYMTSRTAARMSSTTTTDTATRRS
eukprot:scaffold550558_cov106-Attheya_sp.AAC.1